MPQGAGSILAEVVRGRAAAKPAAPATPRKLRRLVRGFIGFSVIRILSPRNAQKARYSDSRRPCRYLFNGGGLSGPREDEGAALSPPPSGGADSMSASHTDFTMSTITKSRASRPVTAIQMVSRRVRIRGIPQLRHLASACATGCRHRPQISPLLLATVPIDPSA